MKQYLEKLTAFKDLTGEEAYDLMNNLMEGNYTTAQITAILTALRMKGEKVDEIASFASVMRSKADRIELNGMELIDTCGTGGDGCATYNISTASALILAAAGVNVAKHGNRSISSSCGSADVLEELGVKVDLPPAEVARCIKQCGIGFMFAPVFHKAMKHAAGPRKELGIRTVFNMLGPLTNPAGASMQMIGVYGDNMTMLVAGVLKKLGTRRAMVVHGMDGMDEISLCAKTTVSELHEDGSIEDYVIDPREYGFEICKPHMISGGNAADNAKVIMDLLNGAVGAKRDVLVLNAGAALYVAGKAGDMRGGIELAGEILRSGAAYIKLQEFIKASNEAAA